MVFKKGQSGNPGGRPKEVGELVELARSMMPTALEQLLKIICDDSEKGLVRVKAIELLSNRAGMLNIEGSSVGITVDGSLAPSVGRVAIEEFLKSKLMRSGE